jgi:RNA polymerase sigma-70 factor (ECF subfamily)
VYGYALSLVKNVHDAEDVLQECYLKLCSAAAAYRKQGKPMAFLLRIVRNLCYDRLRDRQRRESDLSSELAAMSAWPNLSEEDRVTLRACLEELRDEERQVILLHVLGGFRFHEIASFTEEPLSTVLSRYHRAMKKLRIQLS